jgi:hypothetical protein
MRALGRSLLARFRRRPSSNAASVLAVGLALSCGLSPVDDLPSAVDGLTVDGDTDSPGLDIGAGAGGASSASGGAPGFCTPTLHTECRGTEVWQTGTTATCLYVAQPVETCDVSCVVEPNGTAHCTGWGGGGGGGGGGVAGATSMDDGVP